MGEEKNSAHYDNAYNITKAYHGEPEEFESYYPMWLTAASKICLINGANVVDLGCGPGHFCKTLYQEGFGGNFIGYDFSEVAIRMAKKLNKLEHCATFEKKDLLEFDFAKNKDGNTVYVSFEFLEHIEGDLEVIKKIPQGAKVFFSVPSFDYKSHVRFFESEKEVLKRYEKFIKIDFIEAYIQKHALPAKKYIYLFIGSKR